MTELAELGKYPFSLYPVGVSMALFVVAWLSWSWGLFLTSAIRKPIVEVLFWVGLASLFGAIGIIAEPIFSNFFNG